MSNSNPLLANIKKQAQNLARIQNIQLSEAYEIISWAFYHCPNYQDLRKRLLEQNQKSHWFELAISKSSSESISLEKLKKVVPILVDRLSSRVLSNTNRLGLTEQIYKIFDLPVPEDCFNSLFPNASIDGSWQVSLHSEHSPYTVLENRVKINDICYRLLAINVFMPNHWPLKEPAYIEIAKEISPFVSSEFKLNVFEPLALQKAVHSYIQTRLKAPDDDFVEFHYPLTKLSKSEKIIESDIQNLLEITGLDDWNECDDQPIPFNFEGDNMLSNSYLIFGYPIATDDRTLSNKWVMGPNKCPLNDSQIFLLNGLPVALEWISIDPKLIKHNGDYVEHFNSIYSLCSKQFGFVPKLEEQKGLSQLIFIKPASQTQLRRDLELEPYVDDNNDTWLVKVENSHLAEAVINKVFNKDLFIHVTKYGSKEIICKIDGSWDSPPNLSLSIEVLGRRSKRYAHLTTGMSSCMKDGTTTLFITISDYFVNALKAINKDQLIKAMKNGLIHHVEKGTFSNLDDSLDNFFKDLPYLPKNDTNMLNSFELPDDFFSNPLRLLESSRTTQFERRFY